MHPSPLLRTTAVLAVLAVAVMAASGCRWFRKGNPYNQSAESRPLEVPPDLDRPNTTAALGAPTSVTRSEMGGAPAPAAAAPAPQPAPISPTPAQATAAQPVPTESAAPGAATVAAPAQPASAAVTAGAGSFSVAGERDQIFNRVGEALAGVPGVTVATKAQVLGTYDVNYEGSSFLVRVSQAGAVVQVSAMDPRGVPASDAASTKLMAALKTALGG